MAAATSSRMRTGNVIALVALLVILVAQCAEASSYLKKAQRKLEKFATSEMETSKLTREMLLGMVDEYESLSAEGKDSIKQGEPSERLLLHFVILPTLKIKSLLKNKPELFERFKTRIENGYKKFRPAYNNEEIMNGMVTIKIPKLANLYGKLDRDPKQLTLEDFQQAQAEVKVWYERLLSLVEVDDVYAHEKELASILNIMNNTFYRELLMHVLPDVNPDSDPQELAQAYFDLMWADYRIKKVKGKWTRFVR